MVRIMERSNSLGITAYDEHTYGWMLALLISVHYDEEHMPDNHALFNKLQELKKIRHTEKWPSYPYHYLSVYPEDPSMLSKDMFDYAYANGKPVYSMRMVGPVTAVKNRIALRHNFVLLKLSKQAKHEPLGPETSAAKS